MIVAKAPSFWWRPSRSWQARVLRPAGLVYGAVAARRMARSGLVPQAPLLCIGNFTAGGAGKTPTAIALARRLQARGERPAFLSRGHGRTISDDAVIEVDPGRHSAREVGDEPLLLARQAPTFVAVDRRLGAEAAVSAGATVLIMDDGLQNASLRKSASVVVVDGGVGIGNGLCVPAGPLRAPMATQWGAVSILCVMGRGRAGEDLAASARARGVPVVKARLEPEPAAIEGLRGRRLQAFTGIGRPEKFFDTLRRHGLDVVATRAFPDHHVFDAREQNRLLIEAQRSAAELVTTAKDRVRLPPGFNTHVVPVEVVFEEGAEAIDAVLARLTQAPFSRPGA